MIYTSARFLINLKAELPSYAIPLFLRVVRNLDITGATDNDEDFLCHFFKYFRDVQNPETGLGAGGL